MIEANAERSTARAAAPQRPTGRDLDPRTVLTDLFEELHADDPEWLAEQVQRRLADAGFSIVPTTTAED